MKNPLALTLLFLCLGAWVAPAQTINKGDRFWDGKQTFTVEAIWENEQTVFMSAPGEIYMTLKMVPGKTGEYTLAPYGDNPAVPFKGVRFGARVQQVFQQDVEFLVVYAPNGDVAHVLEHRNIPAEDLVGEWRWVGGNIPELILVLDVDSLGNLEVLDLYTYRDQNYNDPDYAYDGSMLTIRKDVDENAYLELYLEPDGEELIGRCVMSGLWKREFDQTIILRRDYFEYD